MSDMQIAKGRNAIGGEDHEITAAVNDDGSVHLMLGDESIVLSSRDFLTWIERIITTPRAEGPTAFSDSDNIMP